MQSSRWRCRESSSDQHWRRGGWGGNKAERAEGRGTLYIPSADLCEVMVIVDRSPERWEDKRSGSESGMWKILE